jgi:hypothetical protein
MAEELEAWLDLMQTIVLIGITCVLIYVSVMLTREVRSMGVILLSIVAALKELKAVMAANDNDRRRD